MGNYIFLNPRDLSLKRYIPKLRVLHSTRKWRSVIHFFFTKVHEKACLLVLERWRKLDTKNFYSRSNLHVIAQLEMPTGLSRRCVKLSIAGMQTLVYLTDVLITNVWSFQLQVRKLRFHLKDEGCRYPSSKAWIPHTYISAISPLGAKHISDSSHA